MPPLSVDTSGRTWTYGVEHELADWDTRKGYEGFGRDPEPNICNSNGIAADPSLKFYPFGAEINTPPTDTPAEQGSLLRRFLTMHPDATFNWRCGMHVHVRVPGLRESLPHLKRVAKFVGENTDVYDHVDPLPRESKAQHGENVKHARRRYNWMRMSHMTVIPPYRVAKQMRATSVEQFFRGEVPVSREGKPLWHAQPRAAINLRQLLQTDTVEFRHYPQTLDLEEVITAVEWCRDYLRCCFDGGGAGSALSLFLASYSGRDFPTLDTIYVHWQDLRWQATTPSRNPRPVVEANIRRFLDEDRRAGKRVPKF